MLELECDAAIHHLPEPSLAVREHRGTLVVGVGSSHAPVLMSIRLHQPGWLILAGSDSETGRDYVASIQALVPAIARIEQIVPVFFPPTDAVRAWQALREALQDAPRPVVIDVTGGTKSMSAAAFYLAVELDIPAVYFRSDAYRASVGAPVPCSGRLQLVESPAAALALHDLRRVEGLWKSCTFGEAADLLEEVIETLEGARADDAMLRGLEEAALMARQLHAWSGADYASIAECPWRPRFLEPLCEGWPHWKDPEEILKAQPDLLFRYLVDAAAWLQRLNHMDSRVRFLRWFALGELAMEGLANALLAAERRPTGKMVERVSGSPPGDDEELDYREQQLATSLKTGRWTVEGMLTAMALGGSPKTRKNCGLSFPEVQIDAAKRWYSGPWRGLRNRCAHGIGAIDQDELTTIARETVALIEQCAGALPEGQVREHLPAWVAEASAQLPMFTSEGGIELPSPPS